MSNLPLEVVEMLGQTIAKVVPITIALALVFSVLTHFWACNPGKPWWRKRELITDICYWFFVPLFARVLRIGLLVLGAGVIFNIHDADGLIAFYDNGHGPLSELPLWLQGLLFLILSDFMLYWLHRMFHGGGFWKYHAIHHSSEDLDWISAARFHPVNLFLGTIAVDVILLMAGISPNVMLWVGPFTTFHSAFVHANLNWTLGTYWQRRSSIAGITRRLKRAVIPILPGLFRSGISCSGPFGCRKIKCRMDMARMSRPFRRRLSDNWPIRFGVS
jgi:sterol desaturase/sphingolipid hydroxylase (fatty acid hydroxylase superfamily)